MDMNERREQHWRSSVTDACEDVLFVLDHEQAIQPTYQRMLSATIDALNAELDYVKSQSHPERES